MLLIIYLRDREHRRASFAEQILMFDYTNNSGLQRACAAAPVLFDPALHSEAFLDATTPSVLSGTSMTLTDLTGPHAGPVFLPTGRAVAAVGVLDTSYQGLFETPIVGENDALTAIDYRLAPPQTGLSRKARWIGAKGCVHPTWSHKMSKVYVTVVSGSILVRMADWKRHAPSTNISSCSKPDNRFVVGVGVDAFLVKSSDQLFDNRDAGAGQTGAPAPITYTEFLVPAGTTLYVPPYIWTSFQYMSSDTVLLCSAYCAWGNLIAYGENYAPHLGRSIRCAWRRFMRPRVPGDIIPHATPHVTLPSAPGATPPSAPGATTPPTPGAPPPSAPGATPEAKERA